MSGRFQLWGNLTEDTDINHANEGKVEKQRLAVASYEKEPTPKGDHENGFQKEFGVFVFVDRK